MRAWMDGSGLLFLCLSVLNAGDGGAAAAAAAAVAAGTGGGRSRIEWR